MSTGRADIASSNLILWGDPSSNRILKDIADRLPIKWDAEGIRADGKLRPSDSHVLLMIYPFLEKRFSGDYAHHNLLQRPRDVPVRTSIGAMAIAFYMVLTLAAMNDIIAFKFHISLNATTWIGRIGMVILPPFIYFITYRWCIGLQRSDREVLEHGVETGIIKRLPHGAYIELHQPLGPVDSHGHPLPLEYEGAAVPKRMNKLGLAGTPGSGSFLTADPASEDAALREAVHAGEQRALTALREYQDSVLSSNGEHGDEH